MRHRTITWKRLVLLWLVLVAAAGDRPGLDEIQVAVSSEEIALSTRLHNGFSEEFLERLESGLPTELTYRFNLYRDRKRWWDGELAKSTYQIIAM